MKQNILRFAALTSLIGVISANMISTTGVESVVSAKISSPNENTKVFLGATFQNINKNDEKRNHIAGVELDLFDSFNQFNNMEDANAYWIRSNAWAIDWGRLEPNFPGQYNSGDPNYGGQYMREYESLVSNAFQRGFKVIQIIRGAPSWASPAGRNGCAIRPEHYDNFANFVYKIVQKYSRAPYYIQYWEVWNEPDGLFDAAGLFGCWGDPSDAKFFGGEAYGRMLTKAGSAIMRADPARSSDGYTGARVVFGGLLLDCKTGAVGGCPSADFLDGALVAGAGQWFHVINFHAYDIWRDNTIVGHYDNPNFGSAWNLDGPTVGTKTDFIRSVLTRNGIGSKAVMNTEAAVQCYCNNLVSGVWDETKAVYLAQSNAVALAKNLLANVWYSYSGWVGHQTNLFDGRGDKAFNAFKTSATQLKDARPVREITSYPGLKVYEFTRRGNSLLVAWKLGDGATTMQLPSTPVAVVDALGNAVSPNSSLNVTLRPLYIELNQPAGQ
jgi:hypothetical protein